jgi:hypothetical protein
LRRVGRNGRWLRRRRHLREGGELGRERHRRQQLRRRRNFERERRLERERRFGGRGGAFGEDAGTGTDATAGGTGPCTAPGILACSDFENGMAPFTVPAQGQVAIDTTQHHSGTKSIKLMGSSAPSNHITTPAGLTFPNNSFYVRAWVYFEQATSAMGGHVDYIVGGTSEDNSGTEVRLGSMPNLKGLDMLNLNEQPPDSTQFSNGDIDGIGGGTTTPGTALDAATWYCIEAFFDGASGSNSFQAWLNENEITGLHVTNFGGQTTGNWEPMYTLVKIGGQNFSGTIGNVWYDDVAVGTQRIHCNPPGPP